MEIKMCKCEHTFQDKTLGKFRRWMNNLQGGGYRCTVCGTSYRGGDK